MKRSTAVGVFVCLCVGLALGLFVRAFAVSIVSSNSGANRHKYVRGTAMRHEKHDQRHVCPRVQAPPLRPPVNKNDGTFGNTMHIKSESVAELYRTTAVGLNTLAKRLFTLVLLLLV